MTGEAEGPEARPLRIAIQIERFDPAQGGAEGYAGALVRGLLALGQEVTVIASEARGAPPGARISLVRVVRHPKALRALLYARRSKQAARAGRFDIVHALGKSLGMNILNPHGGVEAVWLEREFRSHPGRLGRSLWAARRYLSPRHHVVQAVLRRQYRDPAVLRYIALSGAIAEAMVRLHGVDRSRIRVLPNGVDPERFRPARDLAERSEMRRRLGLSTEKLLLLFVANNFRLKGLLPLLQALGRLRAEAPPLSLLVLGRGDLPRYRKLARREGAGEVVDFHGPVRGIEEWYRAVDGFVHPTFYDASSLSLPEAMASGLPVLATRHDGSAELLSGAEGVLLADPDDLPRLVDGLRLFFDAAWRERAGAAGRARILSRPSPEPAAAMLSIYREALSGAPAFSPRLLPRGAC